MSNNNQLSRRRFLQVSTLAAVSGNLLISCARKNQPGTIFKPHEFALVEAIADQIVPPDQDAGGKEAGVANFVEIQLGGPYQRFRDDYETGLAKLEDSCRMLYGKSFLELPFEQQTTFLQTLESNKAPESIWKPGESGRFFRLICDHSLQGYYGSPRHGGNRNYVSWKMLQLDYPQVCGRNLSTS